MRAGLARRRKAIPCQFLYDETGSRLFERICELEEYYPTRAETALLERHRAEIAGLIGPGGQLVELGSGASRKVRLLLDALAEPAAYVAVDISRGHLCRAAAALAADYPALEVAAVCADYTAALWAPPAGAAPAARRVVFFPGSTIGNLGPAAARRLLAACARLVGPGGGMLIGVDLRKDPAVLHAAYDDRDGVTAAFNLNLLARLNRELDGDADLDGFRHRAVWNAARSRVEMHLVSQGPQVVTAAGRRFAFAGGETIHTENSYKYAVPDFHRLAARAGFRAVRTWVGGDGVGGDGAGGGLFSLHYLEAV